MTAPIDAFHENIDRVRALGGVYKSIRSLLTPVVDIEDMLRAQIVLAASALDHLVHEVCRVGMLEILDGKRPETVAFRKFPINLGGLVSAVEGLEAPEAVVESEIRKVNGYRSFQMPDKINQAIKNFSAVDLWKAVAQHLDLSADDVKQKLSLVIERRNKIAHEADIDPSYPGQRWPIDADMTDDVVNFIETVGDAIYAVTRV